MRKDADAEGLAEARIRDARHDRVGGWYARGRARPREGDRLKAADPAQIPRAAAGGSLQSRPRGEFPWWRRWVSARAVPGGDHGRRDRRCDRGADLPGVLPGAVGPHVLPGLTLWAARLLGRCREGGAGGVRRNDGGGPLGPPPSDDAGTRAGQPRAAAVSSLGSRDVCLAQDPHDLGATHGTCSRCRVPPVLEGDDRPLELTLRLALHAIRLVLSHLSSLPPIVLRSRLDGRLRARWWLRPCSHASTPGLARHTGAPVRLCSEPPVEGR